MMQIKIEEQPIFEKFHRVTGIGHYSDNSIKAKNYPEDCGRNDILWDGSKVIKMTATHKLKLAKALKKLEIKPIREEAERIYNMVFRLIDGGNADTIEADLISQIDAAKSEKELEEVKWDQLKLQVLL